jgi:hypothetical protein
MDFVVAPPNRARPQAPVSLPVIVSIRPMMPLAPDPREQLVLHATLVTGTGTPVDGLLSGNTTDSIHSRDDNAQRGYSKFDSLTFLEAGEYQLRVWLSTATETEVVSRQYIDSHTIVVANDPACSHAPSKYNAITL